MRGTGLQNLGLKRDFNCNRLFFFHDSYPLRKLVFTMLERPMRYSFGGM
jgi:hypothetical protein